MLGRWRLLIGAGLLANLSWLQSGSAFAIEPNVCPLRGEVARDYLPQKRYDEAISLVTRMLSEKESGCDEADLFSLRARVHEEARSWAPALEDLNTANGLRPRDPWLLQRRCFVFARLGLLSSARIDCAGAVQAASEANDPIVNASVLSSTASIYSLLGEHDRSISLLQNGLGQLDRISEDEDADRISFSKEQSRVLRRNLVGVLLRAGRADEALHDLHGLISEGAEADLEDRERRAHLYLSKEWYYEAAADLRLLVDMEPQRADFRNNLCWSLAHLELSEEALAHCKVALKLDANNPDILDSLGFALIADGRPEEAVEILNNVLVTHQTNGWALYHLALAYRALGNNVGVEEALSRIQPVVENYPELEKRIQNLSDP